MDHLVFKVYAGCLDVNSCGAQDLKAKAFGSSATGVVGCNLSKTGGLVLSVSRLDSHSKVHFKLSINYTLFICAKFGWFTEFWAVPTNPGIASLI